MNKKLYLIGKVLKTHAIKGEVKVRIDENVNFTNNITLFAYYDDLYIPFKISNFQQIKQSTYIVKFEKINDINQMQKYVNCDLYANEKDVTIEKIVSLTNFKVIKDNEIIGEVIDVLSTMAHDILRIKLTANIKEILVPNIDTFVKKIDYENKLIIVDLIEGFL